MKSRARTPKWLRRYKAFRELEEHAACLADEVATLTADLEQLREEVEWEEAGRKLQAQRAATWAGFPE